MQAQQIQQMPTFDQMYAFLREHYLHSRFEERNAWWPNGVPEGGTYAELITRNAIKTLEEVGVGFVSMYESRLGRVIKYDASLSILNPDEPPAQIQKQASHLTHLLDC